MVIHAHKNGNESNDGLQQRFKRQVQRTGLLKMLRKRSKHTKNANKRIIRNSALKREEYRSKNRKQQFYSNM
ncbi:30S ribosomal protein S21 [Candidatus Peregrinibacteria bacterium]|nr:30S ribosomal protein S21 [Candidatus Peregrinibacteria bacterium]MBT3598662.1 30S ribosomal protein S21 [Candidatus Peregrinibacteria bacterium]MBT4366903.1 30S ribosomal protein S21 [Candidatus Peregrinibacteria bacterium]MBT4585327.1 30S ribosomal protein S21 [Candidatus Peregrinibacteria bacterium]MBT6730939.1 30S ribosomal protein S21 [Candidatus Peregrinibacteria bacterium]